VINVLALLTCRVFCYSTQACHFQVCPFHVSISWSAFLRLSFLPLCSFSVCHIQVFSVAAARPIFVYNTMGVTRPVARLRLQHLRFVKRTGFSESVESNAYHSVLRAVCIAVSQPMASKLWRTDNMLVIVISPWAPPLSCCAVSEWVSVDWFPALRCRSTAVSPFPRVRSVSGTEWKQHSVMATLFTRRRLKRSYPEYCN